jgi:ribosomal protein S18 acetylase RimI-like enzyme
MGHNAEETRIRDAVEADASEVDRLMHELAASESFVSPLTPAFVAQCLSHAGYGLLLAERGARVVGALAYLVRPNLLHAGPACLLEELVVDASCRGSGIGSLLLEELIRRQAAAGAAEISVAVMPDNQGALRFYRRHGLVEEVVLLERHFGDSPSARDTASSSGSASPSAR